MKNEVKFRRQFSGQPPYKGYTPEGGWPKSQTVPDMSLSVRQLMERNTRGIETGIEAKQELYEDDIGGEVPRHEDIVDVHEAKQDLENRANEALARERERIKDERAKKAAEEAAKKKSEQDKGEAPEDTEA